MSEQQNIKPKTDNKKYWLKIEKDFLNSQHIKVIKSFDNGKDYILFYLQLMLSSADTEGHLKFTELVAYDEKMLSALTDTNIDIVRSAITIFQQLGLMQILEDGTIFLPDVPKRVGRESESAERVRKFREKQIMLHCNKNITLQNVTKCVTNATIKRKIKKEEKDKEKHKEKECEKENRKFGKFSNVCLTEQQMQQLILDFGQDLTNNIIEELSIYMESKGNEYKNHYATILNFIKRNQERKAIEEKTTPTADKKGMADYGY